MCSCCDRARKGKAAETLGHRNNAQTPLVRLRHPVLRMRTPPAMRVSILLAFCWLIANVPTVMAQRRRCRRWATIAPRLRPHLPASMRRRRQCPGLVSQILRSIPDATTWMPIHRDPPPAGARFRDGLSLAFATGSFGLESWSEVPRKPAMPSVRRANGARDPTSTGGGNRQMLSDPHVPEHRGHELDDVSDRLPESRRVIPFSPRHVCHFI
jgi:hypothetical protein